MSGQGHAGCRCGKSFTNDFDKDKFDKDKFESLLNQVFSKWESDNVGRSSGGWVDVGRSLGRWVSLDSGKYMEKYSEKKSKKSKHIKRKYPEDVKFSYYGETGFGNGHTGILVLASKLWPEENSVFYGCAWCSPNDVYNKETGKSIAYADLDGNLYSADVGRKKHHEINARILSMIFASNEYPSWAEKMVAYELINHLMSAFNLDEYLF